MSATVTTELFQEISCPLCQSASFDVLKSARYPASITASDLKHSYSASSSHQLLDQVVRCRACGLGYVNPRPDPGIIIESYADAVDPTFVAQNTQRIQTFRKNLRQVLVDLRIPSGEGRRLLDVGCAGGAFPVAARDMGFEAVGVEPSRWMADYGRKTYGLDIRDGILVDGMFPPQSFDVITLWDVLEHVPSPGDLLRLIHSLLRPGGALVVNYPDAGSAAARLLGWRWPFWLSVHLLYYDRTTIRRQVEQCGYQVLRIRPYWQSLQLGYILHRAAPYVPGAEFLSKAVNAIGVGKLSVPYQMGQTLVVAKKDM